MRVALALIASSIACATAPAPAPEVPLAQRWSVAPDAPKREAPGGSLWSRFESRELGVLIHAAADHSLANASAAARAVEQRALERVARAAEYPSLIASVDLSGQSDNNKRLGNVRGGFLDAGLTAAYDVDVWGKNRERTKAAQARADASHFDRAAIALDVTAAVAETYFEILSLRERLARARANLEATQRVLEIVEARQRAGAALAREVAQQRSLVAAETAYLERLVAAEADQRVSLALLLGREPTAIAVEVETLDSVVDPAITSDDLSVPATLLSRRPDVARAEAELAAAHADVEAARAALFPQLRLSATAAVQSVFGSNFYDGNAVIYLGGVSVTQPIIDGGGLSAERDAATARRATAEAEYRQIALQAAGEVERALRTRAGVRKQYEQQRLALQEARRAFELLEIEYQAGAGELLAVLDAQRTLFRTEDELSQLHLAKLRASVALVKALGAGSEAKR